MRISNALRENSPRGTADFPFSHYRLSREQMTPIITKLHWHTEFEILYAHTGELEVLNGGTALRLAEGDISFVSPQRLHSTRALRVPVVYDAFVFRPELIALPENHFFYQQFLHPLQTGEKLLPLHLTPADSCYPQIRGALERICGKDAAEPQYRPEVMAAIMEICSLLFLKLSPCEERIFRKNHDVVKQCLNCMEENYSGHLTLQQLAEQVHLHPNYLCALFKKQTGQTVFQALLRVRIEKAAELLRKETLTVQQTAELCGFESACFFSKKFKEYWGVSPKEYQKKMR